MGKRSLVVACLIFSFCFSFTNALQGTYFVSPLIGSSSNDGSTPETPFLSISDAMGKPPGKNGVLHIQLLEGNYTGSGNIGLTFNQPTRIMHSSDSFVTFDCHGEPDTVFTSNTYFSVTGFRYEYTVFQNCEIGISIDGSEANSISNEFNFEVLKFINVTKAIDTINVPIISLKHCDFEDSFLNVIGPNQQESSVFMRFTSFSGKGFNIEKYETVIIAESRVEKVYSVGSSPLNIQAGDIKIAFMGITDCSSTVSGGAMSIVGPCELFVVESKFENCISARDGGALNLISASSVMNDIRFSHCHADGNGGGIYYSSKGSEFSFIHTRFDNCSATYGGALDLEGRMFDAYFSEVIFTNNYASANGSCAACCATPNALCNIVPIDVESVYTMDNSETVSLFTCQLDYQSIDI